MSIKIEKTGVKNEDRDYKIMKGFFEMDKEIYVNVFALGEIFKEELHDGKIQIEVA
jgi:hypothetical protein